MALLRVDIESVTEGTQWSGQVNVGNLNYNVINTSPEIQTVYWQFPPGNSGNIFFSTQIHLTFPSTTGSDLNYFTFRSQNNSNAQFPTVQTGLSLDVWSDDFHNFILTDTSPTWQSILDTYWDLSEDKFTLVYDYDNLYAPYYSKGGTIRFHEL